MTRKAGLMNSLETDHPCRDMLDWVHKVVCDFHAAYGGDREELDSEAYWHWFRAWRTYDGRSSASNWVRHCVWHGLLATRRRQLNRDRLCRRQPLAEEPVAASHFDLFAIAGELSSDAACLMRLALDVPADLRAVLATSPEGKIGTRCLRARSPSPCRPPTPERVGWALIRYLRGIGWTPGRVRRAWDEVREALGCSFG